ncbi:hypothetical protein WJX72_007210 [[Myrmecia] bisecta]|uniref:Uncharacterized protein n=1 Tax=[Myrmecia] bisecta TaxID=41462 RepID=A0AAW1PH40_9CHLO
MRAELGQNGNLRNDCISFKLAVDQKRPDVDRCPESLFAAQYTFTFHLLQHISPKTGCQKVWKGSGAAKLCIMSEKWGQMDGVESSAAATHEISLEAAPGYGSGPAARRGQQSNKIPLLLLALLFFWQLLVLAVAAASLKEVHDVAGMKDALAKYQTQD